MAALRSSLPIALVIASACAARTAGPHRATAAAPHARLAPTVSRAPPTPVVPPPPPERARFTLDLDEVGQRVFLVSQELGLREEVATYRDPFRCVAAVPFGQPREPFTHAQISIDCGPQGGRTAVLVETGKAVVVRPERANEKRIAFAGVVELDATLPAGGPPRSGTCPRTSVTVFVERRSGPFSLAVRVPELNVSFPLGWSGHDRVSCYSQLRRAARRMTYGCSSQETSTGIDVRERDGVLQFVRIGDSYDHGRTRFPLRAVVLPCGANVTFVKFAYRHPRWSPVGFTFCGCSDVHSTCASACYENLSDQQGELTDAGWACHQRCDAAFDACRQRCPIDKW
jgi:hypothetical protein